MSRMQVSLKRKVGVHGPGVSRVRSATDATWTRELHASSRWSCTTSETRGDDFSLNHNQVATLSLRLVSQVAIMSQTEYVPHPRGSSQIPPAMACFCPARNLATPLPSSLTLPCPTSRL